MKSGRISLVAGLLLGFVLPWFVGCAGKAVSMSMPDTKIEANEPFLLPEIVVTAESVIPMLDEIVVTAERIKDGESTATPSASEREADPKAAPAGGPVLGASSAQPDRMPQFPAMSTRPGHGRPMAE